MSVCGFFMCVCVFFLCLITFMIIMHRDIYISRPFQSRDAGSSFDKVFAPCWIKDSLLSCDKLAARVSP